jgi:hypothetical protein
MDYKIEKKIYLASYLIFSITYCHIFKGLSVKKRVTPNVHPKTMWYQALWRHKFIHYFYEVYNDFTFEFKKSLFGEDTSILSLEASTFLNTKGVLQKMDNYNIIMIFFSHEKPIFNNQDLNYLWQTKMMLSRVTIVFPLFQRIVSNINIFSQHMIMQRISKNKYQSKSYRRKIKSILELKVPQCEFGS